MNQFRSRGRLVLVVTRTIFAVSRTADTAWEAAAFAETLPASTALLAFEPTDDGSAAHKTLFSSHCYHLLSNCVRI